MKQQLEDFGVTLDHIPPKCDNASATNMSKNSVMHSRTKHIEIRHHFLRDHVSKGDCCIEFVGSCQTLISSGYNVLSFGYNALIIANRIAVFGTGYNARPWGRSGF